MKSLVLSAWLACSTLFAAENSRIEVKKFESASEITVSGQPGDAYRIESTDDLSEQNWRILRELSLASPKAIFNDPWCGTAPRQFYRLLPANPPGTQRAGNFRLIDHQGKSRELYYYYPDPAIDGFVLIFAKNGCDELQAQIASIKALQTQYPHILFWMVDANPADTRSTIAAQATKLAMSWPVFQDPAQSVTRAYNVTRSPEVICIRKDDMAITYRGAIDDRLSASQGTAQENYLANAVAALADGDISQITETRPTGCEITNAPLSEISYSTDVAPILQTKCVICHSPGNVAPWSMTNHAIISTQALNMEYQIMTHQMPPWHADAEYGAFSNDMSLSLAQEQTLLRWIRSGAPRGDGPDPLENIPAPPPIWPVELGEPDMIIRAPEQDVESTGVEPYRYIFVQSGIPSNVWVKAAIIRPTNPGIVHHYLVWEGKSAQQMATGIAGYVPGTQEGAFPEGTGLLLNANIDLTFNLHYTPNGKSGKDTPELALWFHKTPPKKSIHVLPLLTPSLNIPAGARETIVTTPTIPLPRPMTIYRLSPHMHLRGAWMRYDVAFPDGHKETLLSVPNYKFQWQTGYVLKTPRTLPAGAKITVTGAFDNSTLNLQNPDPTATVSWGEQSFEEMFIGYIEYTD